MLTRACCKHAVFSFRLLFLSGCHAVLCCVCGQGVVRRGEWGTLHPFTAGGGGGRWAALGRALYRFWRMHIPLEDFMGFFVPPPPLCGAVTAWRNSTYKRELLAEPPYTYCAAGRPKHTPRWLSSLSHHSTRTHTHSHAWRAGLQLTRRGASGGGPPGVGWGGGQQRCGWPQS